MSSGYLLQKYRVINKLNDSHQEIRLQCPTNSHPQASYFNHSCHGAVARYFVGARMVLVATLSVAAGEEVHENYGPTFYFKGRAERQRHLR